MQGSGTRSPPAAARLLVAPLEANTLLGDQGGINPLSPPSETSPMPALPPDKYSLPELMRLEDQDLSGSISPAKSLQDSWPFEVLCEFAYTEVYTVKSGFDKTRGGILPFLSRNHKTQNP